MSTTVLPKRYSPSVFNGVAGMIDNDQGGYVRFHDCVTYGTACAEAAKATGTAGELFGYGSSEKKNCLLSKAQYDNCAPKNRTAYDIPLYAHSLPKCEGCKGYGVITHVSGQTPDNYQECNEECPECQGTGEAARQPVSVDGNDAFKEAYMEWSRKTDWVQEQIRTFPVNSLGMHRADVMREEIERLRAERKPASIVVKTWRERKAAYHLEVREAQPDAVFMALEIEDLRAALTRQKKEA